jgi:hypothetical protein
MIVGFHGATDGIEVTLAEEDPRCTDCNRRVELYPDSIRPWRCVPCYDDNVAGEASAHAHR